MSCASLSTGAMFGTYIVRNNSPKTELVSLYNNSIVFNEFGLRSSDLSSSLWAHIIVLNAI